LRHTLDHSPQVLRAGVVGIGTFGRHHAAKYAALASVELAGVADPSAEARRVATAKHGVPAVSDWRDLLGAVDVVSICSPAVTHAPIVRAFLNAGAHVLVEKPIATNLAEADQLIALAEATGRVLTVGHQERFVFARTGLLDYVDAPHEVECWRMGPWSGRGGDVSVAVDLMIHDLDLVHRLIPGAVVDVDAKGYARHGRHADEVAALVGFEGGAQARLSASRMAPSRSRGMRAIYGDGVIEIDFVARTVRNTTSRLLNPLKLEDPLGESVESFVNAVRMGAETLVRPEEARRALETALLIDDACKSRRETSAFGRYAAHA
jgi:predicted dehydrogenase